MRYDRPHVVGSSVREMEATIQDTLLQLSQLAGGGRGGGGGGTPSSPAAVKEEHQTL